MRGIPTLPTLRLASPALLSIAALAVTGCFSDRGVALEVDVGDTGAATVELYLGTQACDPRTNTAGITCASIAPPPDGKLALAGDVWFRDGLTPEVAQVKGGKATFQLRADTPTTLPIVVVVGLASSQGTIAVGAATLRDLAVPVNSARVVATTLASTAGAVARNAEDRVLVWRKASPPSSCVMIEHGGTAPVTRDFVVPAEDPDCDDAAAPECNPAAYLGSNLVGGVRDRPECFSSSGGPACVLGAFGCQDNVAGNDNKCVPLASRICVPDAFCSCTMSDEPCIRSKLGPPPNPVARLDCQVPTMLAVGSVGLCPGQVQATVDLGAFFPGECPDPQIGTLSTTGFDGHQSFDGATMKLSSASKPCKFTITWTDGTRPRLAAMEDFGILRFASDPGATVLLPVVFHFLPPTDNCITTDFTCGYAGDPTDALWSCAP